MTALDASQAHVRLAFANASIDGRLTSAWQDVRMRGESFAIGNPLIDAEDITADAYQEPGAESKFQVGGDTPGMDITLSPDDHYKILAAHFGASATPVQSPTGVYTHHLGASETDVSFGDLNVEIWRQRVRGYLFTNYLPAELSFEVGPRGFLLGGVQFVGNRFTLLGEAAEEAVGTPGTPELPAVRGLARAGLADDIYFEVQSIGSGTMDIKVKVGAASTYDGAAITITDGIWSDSLTDESDADLGAVGERVQLYIADTSTYTALDEIKIPYQRPDWSPSLADSSRLNEIAVTITIDGTEASLRQLSLTSTRPASVDEVIGGRFSDGRDESGFWSATWGITRRAIREVDLEDDLIHASQVQIVATALSTEIGATGVRRAVIFRSLNCRPTGETFAVGGPDNPEEAYELRAHPSDDVSYPHALNCEIRNAIADLTA